MQLEHSSGFRLVPEPLTGSGWPVPDICRVCLDSAETSEDARCGPEEAVSAALEANRRSLLEQLDQDGGLQQVRRLREAVRAEAPWVSSPSGDVAWDFVQECLVLLLALARHLSAELELAQQGPPPPGTAPSLAPDVLSVAQQRGLSSALQFVVSLGLSPYLAPGVGLPLARRSAFGARVQQLCVGTVGGAGRRLFTTTSVLLKVAELPSLAAVVFTQHLNDVMAALCQLGHAEKVTRRFH